MSWGSKLMAARANGTARCGNCWDCLRAAGITPEASVADRYPDCNGARYRTHNGQPARRAPKPEAEVTA